MNLLRCRVFYLPMVELGNKEYRGFIFLSTVILVKPTSKEYSFSYRLCSHKVLLQRSTWRGSTYSSQPNHITSYQRGCNEATYNGLADSSMIFLRMISFWSSKQTLSPPITQEGYHYDFQLKGYHNLPSRLKVPQKGPS